MDALRCSICLINWPMVSIYHRCPQCDCSTSALEVYEGDILPWGEARALCVVAIGEAETMRLENEWQETRDAQMKASQGRTEIIHTRFADVIQCGGFTKGDRQLFQHLEAELARHDDPRTHLPK